MTTTRTPRADAVRNREAVLQAAAELFDGVDGSTDVTTDAIARQAGVGKATLFRAFGDRAGLLRAVYDLRAEDVLATVSAGPPPLGPGAAPDARIPAVLDALLTFKIRNRALSRALELLSPNSPYTGRHYEAWHALLAAELRRLGLRGTADYYADALLAAVRSDLIEHQLATRAMSPASIRGNLRAYAERLISTLPKSRTR